MTSLADSPDLMAQRRSPNWLQAGTVLKWVLLGCIAFHLAVVAVPRTNGQLVASDGIEFYIHLRSLVIDQDLDFASEYRYFQEKGYPTPPLSAAGRIANKHAAVGVALLWSPFFLAAHAAVKLLGAAGVAIAADGYNLVYQAAVGLGSALYGALGCVFAYLSARRYYPAWPAALAVIVVWLASNALYYMAIEPSMSHMLSLFAVSSALSLWLLKLRDVARPRLRDFALLGLACGLVMTVRTQDTAFLAIPLGYMMAHWVRCLRQPGRPDLAHWSAGMLLTGAVALTLVALQFQTWHALYGVWHESPMRHDQPQVFNWTEPRLLEVLFSGLHGLFSWHPVTLASTLGLFLFYRRDATLACLLLLAFAVQVYVVAAWWGWSQGGSFGGRVFLNCLWLWVIGLAAVFAWAAPRRPWLAAATTLSALCIAWNALSFSQFSLGLINHETHPSLRELTIDRLLISQQLVGLLLERVRAP